MLARTHEAPGTARDGKCKGRTGRTGLHHHLAFVPSHFHAMATNTSAHQAILQQLMTPKPRKQRKECEYTKQERAIMERYKEDFKRTTGQERDGILRGKLLVDLFNFWHKRGMYVAAEDMENQVTV